ncbi:MAG: CHC2 zinc finger domain-containing protein, partial [Candidatus Woesearchaeota archaeon]
MKIKELKEKINIIEIIEKYIDLEKLSKEYRGLCPFHMDNKTKSFYVNEKKGLWKCFGCDKSGDVITFIQEIEDLSFREAVNYLSNGEDIEFNNNYKKLENTISLLDIQASKKKHKLDEKMLNKYKKEQHGYFLNLGFDKDILKFFEIGYCNDPGDELYNRITIPWRDENGNLVAIAGRDFTDKKENKYMAKKDSHKNNYLYNLNNAKYFCDNGLITVEDEKSVIKLWQWGYKNVVALGNKDISN